MTPSCRPVRAFFPALILLLLALPGSPATAQDDARKVMMLRLDGRLQPVQTLRERDRDYVNLADLADALGGEWGRDPLSRDPLLTFGNHRILFSTDDRRVAIDGRRRRMTRPLEMRNDGIYVPSSFLGRYLEELVGGEVQLVGGTGDGETEPERPRLEEMRDDDGGFTGSDPDDTRSSPFNRRSRGSGAVRVVVIDPGHGGMEEGAAGPTGLLEKDVVLEVCRRLKSRLEADGLQVVLTRNADRTVELDERTALANNAKADLFLSIHANASPSPEARGAETYYLSLGRADHQAQQEFAGSEPGALLTPEEQADPLQSILWDMAQTTWLAESSALAELIQADFNELLDIPDRGVKQAPLRVLVGATMPAVLVEIGFISNPEEETRLQDPEFIDEIVSSLTRSIWTYDERVARRRGAWDGGTGGP